MDIITIVSVVLSFVALLAAFVLEGGSLLALLQPTAALIVFGGTFGAIGVSFKGKTLKMVPQLLKRAFQNKREDRKQILDTLLELSTITKRDGLLALEKEISTGNYHPLIRTSLQLIIDSASNWQLSSVRAANVVYYLVNTCNLPGDRLSAVGYGEFNPKASNDTESGRRKNRRIDLVIPYLTEEDAE